MATDETATQPASSFIHDRRTLLQLGAAAIASPMLANSAMADEKADTLVWADTMSPGADPHVVYDTPMWFIAFNLYDNLYRYEGNPPQIRPWLAESHSVSDDGLTYVFKLREGIKFHDDGDMTAADVVYSFQRLLALGKGPSGAFLPIIKAENIVATGPREVTFKLNQPYSPFLSAIPLVAIVNSALLKKQATAADPWAATWLSSNEAGSGAYKLVPNSYESMVRFDYARFDKHFLGWGHNPKPINLVRARYIKESSTRVNALIRGDVDVGGVANTSEELARLSAAPNVEVRTDPAMRLFVVTMNNQRAPFDNINVRKAFSHAFNYDAFINVILKGNARPSKAPLPNDLWGNPKDIEGYAFDLDKAKTYLDRARAEGVVFNRPLKFHYQSDEDQTKQAGQLLQGDLRKIGVEIELTVDMFARIAAGSTKPETTPDMWIHWVSAYFVDPENWIGQMYDSRFHGTWKASSWYKNKEVDDLLGRARTVNDQAERAQLYSKAARLIVADAPEIYIYDSVVTRAMSKRVKNYKFGSVGYGAEIRVMSVG